MRTTVTLDPDVELLIKRAMQRRGVSFKQAVNDSIRAGIAPRRSGERPTFPTYDMGSPLVDVTKALQIAGELEDQELARELATGK
ncbi:MAG: antitoxin [Solirubrobacteraceae bacterium]